VSCRLQVSHVLAMASKPPSLDDLDAPDWFLQAADDLKSTRPRWCKGLPAIALRGGAMLPADAYPWTLSALAYIEAEAVRHDIVDLLRRHGELASVDLWMAAVVDAWVAGAAPVRDAWVLTGASFLGGDATVRSLRDAVRRCSRDKDRTLALRGLDALSRIGSEAALEEVAVLSAGIRDRSVADEAQQLMEHKAAAQGASRGEIEDSLVSRCGIDRKGERLFSFGPRQFRAVFGKDLSLTLFGEDGRKRVSMPPVASTDDRAVAEASRAAWSEMKTAVPRIVKAQVKRLEQAMITGRSWSFGEFRERLLSHPIISQIAQLLIWQTVEDESRSLRVTEDLSLAGVTDNAVSLEESMQLRLAHPLRLSPDELTAWRNLFADYHLVQPFSQLAREVSMCDEALASNTLLPIPPHTPLKSGVLYGILENDGWRLSWASESVFRASWKSFVADDVTALISYTGLLVGAVGKSADQTIRDCSFYRGIMAPDQRHLPGKILPLGEVPPVAFSETTRRILRLTTEKG